MIEAGFDSTRPAVFEPSSQHEQAVQPAGIASQRASVDAPAVPGNDATIAAKANHRGRRMRRAMDMLDPRTRPGDLTWTILSVSATEARRNASDRLVRAGRVV